MKRILFLLLFLLSSHTSDAKSFSQAHTAFQRGDYAIALDMFRHLAEQGDGRAPLYLARLYEMNSVTIPRNWKKVFEWYHEAATVYESAESMYHLARLFEEGNGTPRDMQKAFFWYDQAAHKNDALAQDKVAHMYLYGIGVPQDETKAFFWQTQAAQQGLPRAFFHLAHFYKHGVATPQDIKESHRLREKAARLGHSEAQFQIAMLFVDGRDRPHDLRQAYQWMYLSAQGGYDAARDAEQWLRRRLAVTDIPTLQANAHRLADLTPPSFHLITAY